MNLAEFLFAALGYIIAVLFAVAHVRAFLRRRRERERERIAALVHWHLPGTQRHACGDLRGECSELYPDSVDCPQCRAYLDSQNPCLRPAKACS